MAKKKGPKSPIAPATEPWGEPVDGQAVMAELVASLNKYLILPKGAAEALALWVMFTHGFEAWECNPRLAFISTSPECGKTTALSVVGSLTPKTLFASNITPAVVFRIIEKAQPTLMIDEADTFLDDADSMRGILNSGHTPTTAFVWRCHAETNDPEGFSTWAPMAVAKIGSLPPILRSRSIVVVMSRKAPDASMERFRPRDIPGLAEIARRCSRWARDNIDALRDADPRLPSEITGRLADNWRPLFAISDTIGGLWPDLARRSALDLLTQRTNIVTVKEELDAPAYREQIVRFVQDRQAISGKAVPEYAIRSHVGKSVGPELIRSALDYLVRHGELRAVEGTTAPYRQLISGDNNVGREQTSAVS